MTNPDITSIESPKVLLIAHEFPPISGGQVMRMLKFAKYLPVYGWSPIVLTALPEDCYYFNSWSADPGLSKQLGESTEVIQTASPLERWLARAVRLFKKGTNSSSKHASSKGDSTHKEQHSFLKALLRVHVTQDQSILWLPFAYFTAFKLIHNRHLKVIVTSTPPHLLHLLGYILKVTTGVRWLADFRDGWTDNPLFQSRSRLRSTVDRWIEHLILKHADVVVVVTKHMQHSFEKRYPQFANKVKLIYNGFDKQDFQLLSSTPRLVDKVVFCYVGNWGGFRDPSTLFLAVDELFSEKVLDPENVEVSFIGNYHVSGISVPDWVRIKSSVPHQEAIQSMIDSDILLLLASSDEREAAFTSKVFEYLATERTILGLIPPVGELADLLNEYSRGVVTSPDNLSEIKRGIIDAYQIARDRHPLTSNDLVMIAKYDRVHQAGQVSDLLNDLNLYTTNNDNV